ncbi:MAG TPA: response regulator transcription factor, partial [Candidatus Limnocylindrales bacterium]
MTVSVNPKRIRVLLVDDRQLLTDALAHVLGDEPDIDVVGVACSVGATKRLARRVDVALVDYRLPDGTGADAARAIRARHPAARVVMLTEVSDDVAIRASIRAGTDAFVTEHDPFRDVVSAVRSVHAGTAVARRTIASDRGARSHRRMRARDDVATDGLTPREAEV